MPKVQITKLDAVRAQIDAAIELYFVSDNIVATHTLVAASYNILRDLAHKEGSEHPFLKSGFLKTLTDSEKKQTIQFLNKPENFFKHAVNDSSDTLTFDTELTEILLMDACSYFKSKDILKPKNYEIFKAWVGEIRKDVTIDDNRRILVKTLIEKFKAGGKKEFWVTFNKHKSFRQS